MPARPWFSVVVALALAVLLAVPAAIAQEDRPGAEAVVIRCGALLVVPGEAPMGEATVVVIGGEVSRVARGHPPLATLAPQDIAVREIDLSGRFVMPGLIDCHTHITGQYSKDVRLRRLSESDADAAINGVVYARRTLMAGFTTIRNVGSSGDATFALRDAINDGKIPGPRILVAGESISPTGGHSDGTLGYRDDLFDPPGTDVGIADGADMCRQAVRAQVKRGADLIKLTATGGVLSNTAAGVEQQFFDDELAAIVETGHLLGRRVAAHAHGATGIKAALRAGVDSIEHGTYLDDECIELFRETGAYLVPTVHAGKFVEYKAREDGYFPPPVRHKAAMVGPQIQDALRRAYEGGVKIAFGTDVGVGEHGTNAREFEYMHGAGIPMAVTLRMATVDAAELCGLTDQIGTVEPGKRADLIAVAGDPLEGPTGQPAVMMDVVFVMKDGVVHRLDD